MQLFFIKVMESDFFSLETVFGVFWTFLLLLKAFVVFKMWT